MSDHRIMKAFSVNFTAPGDQVSAVVVATDFTSAGKLAEEYRLRECPELFFESIRAISGVVILGQ